MKTLILVFDNSIGNKKDLLAACDSLEKAEVLILERLQKLYPIPETATFWEAEEIDNNRIQYREKYLRVVEVPVNELRF
jgi:hypothetical protein